MDTNSGFFYVLDRTNGAFLHAQPFAKVTWASEVRADGRPVVLPGTDPSPEGTYVCPGVGGAANWHSPSFHPATGLVYVAVIEQCNTVYSSPTPYREGLQYFGSAILDVAKERGRGAVRAIDPRMAKVVWEFELHSPAMDDQKGRNRHVRVGAFPASPVVSAVDVTAAPPPRL